MLTTETPPSMCLKCGVWLDCASAEEAVPSPGDLTICIKCGQTMAFDKHLRLRELTAEEAQAMAGDRRIIAVQQTIQRRNRVDRARFN